ncbi:MAG: SIR2 family protein, partial [Candidatus Magnetominusculus sp. LBB02]|nr:SIR2 family protein [Candidatus Magnetominusculus sp. LBB02]
MFYNFIRENLTVKTIKDFHKSYGEITWKKIYTLNVDNAHEEILNANNKPFSIFDSRSPVYRSPSDSAIYKLRGSVTNVNAGVTFSKVSYRQSAAHSVNDKRLSDLINDFQTDNFLLIGVSFDDELDIEIEMLKQNVVSNAFYHVAPKLSELQQGRIRRMFPNVVFIDETAESFINKLRSFKSRVEVLPTTFIENVEKIGYNVISKDKYFKAKHQSPNMYKGMQPTWEDIFTNHDVITKRTESIVDTLNNKGNEIKCLVITDKEISGKTTLLYRIGVHFSDDYNVLEFVGDDFDASLTQLNALVIKHHVDKKIMILVDDASWIIDPGMNIINSIQNLNVQLILTLGQKEYNRFFYIFTESNNVKYKIRIESEIRVIDDDDALRFIKKLKSKTYLGSYAGVTTEEAAKKFMQRLKKNDILIALYEFNEGSSFTERI